jgi:small-conductance mechanosensitive channel
LGPSATGLLPRSTPPEGLHFTYGLNTPRRAFISLTAPTVAVLELGQSSVNFAVRPWVKTQDYWDVFFPTQEKIKK